MKAHELCVLLEAFKKDVGLTRFQIESFENFVENGIQRVIDEIGVLKPEVPEGVEPLLLDYQAAEPLNVPPASGQRRFD